mgnify:CR=1 FL=1
MVGLGGMVAPLPAKPANLEMDEGDETGAIPAAAGTPDPI